jgi:uncharacterized protein
MPMLRHTFMHLPRVGEGMERRLWAAGVCRWEDAAAGHPLTRRLCPAGLRDSVEHHGRGDPAYFAARLPAAQAWRLFGDFRAQVAFLDIETTGMGPGDHVTTIALYDGRAVRTYVHGQNLDAFAHDVRAYRLLVTYNGKCFDLPFLARALGVRLDQAHIDLRYVLAALGYRGGLKGCERQLGVARPGLEDVDGFLAVLLWREYRRRGDPRALETLLAYNVADTVSLERLMVHAYNARLATLDAPFAAGYLLGVPPAPPNPYRPCAETLRRVRGMMWGRG